MLGRITRWVSVVVMRGTLGAEPFGGRRSVGDRVAAVTGGGTASPPGVGGEAVDAPGRVSR
ncbi:hypothetical protein SNE510_08000 [Streptomyces sp. NE5-10]|nr:hypothetical protein SNE510_08000 [Streptomyces sp. NE5-10]